MKVKIIRTGVKTLKRNRKRKKKKMHLMLQKQGFERTLGPKIHGVGKQLHGDSVHPQKIAHKHHSLDFLKQQTWQNQFKVIRLSQTTTQNKDKCYDFSCHVTRIQAQNAMNAKMNTKSITNWRTMNQRRSVRKVILILLCLNSLLNHLIIKKNDTEQWQVIN